MEGEEEEDDEGEAYESDPDEDDAGTMTAAQPGAQQAAGSQQAAQVQVQHTVSRQSLQRTLHTCRCQAAKARPAHARHAMERPADSRAPHTSREASRSRGNQALVVDDAVEGEEELVAQLVADPTLPAVWAAMLTEEAEVRSQRCALHVHDAGGEPLHESVSMAPADERAVLRPGAGRAGFAAVLGGAGLASLCQAGGDQAVQALEVHAFLRARLCWRSNLPEVPMNMGWLLIGGWTALQQAAGCGHPDSVGAAAVLPSGLPEL